MSLPHYTNIEASKQEWVDHDMYNKYIRSIKLQKIRYLIKNGTTEGFVLKR
jgi:hypothetical protein